MNKKTVTFAFLTALIAMVLNSQYVFAHESVTFGNYEVVYGWTDEPPIEGQLNGVEIFVTNTTKNEPAEEHIIHSLVVELTYGGESKILTLDPGFEEPGAFRATILPTIPGLYSLKFSGTIGETAVDTEVELEEVQAPEAVQFPSAGATQQQPAETGTADWLVWLSLLLALMGIGLGTIALRRAR